MDFRRKRRIRGIKVGSPDNAGIFWKVSKSRFLRLLDCMASPKAASFPK